MTDNLNAFNALGMKSAWGQIWHDTSANYVCGTDPDLTNGENSGMMRLTGVSDFGVTTPTASSQGIPGDNGIIASYMVNSTDAPSGNMSWGSYPQEFYVAAMKKVIKAEGVHDLTGSSTSCNEFRPIHMVVNSPAKSDVSGSAGEAGYMVTEYLYGFIQDMGNEAMTVNGNVVFTGYTTWNDRGVTPWGETITSGNYGRTRLWKFDPYWSKYPVYYETYVGDGGAAQTFTLSNSILPYVASASGLQIWDNGSKMTYTTNYSVNITTGLVTFVGTDPAAGQFAVCKVCYSDSC
jgi:hypothetical protein